METKEYKGIVQSFSEEAGLIIKTNVGFTVFGFDYKKITITVEKES
jgi:hypothetical protein